MVGSRADRIPPLAWLFAIVGFLPTVACLGAGIWLVVAGRVIFGAALIAAAAVVEIGQRRWVRTLRRWARTPG